MTKEQIKTINRVAYNLTFLLWWYEIKGMKNARN